MSAGQEYQQPRVDEVLDTGRPRRRRRELGLTSQDLSRAVGLPLTSICRIEAGDGDALLTVAQLARLANVLAVPMVDLLLTAEPDRSTGDSADDAARVATPLLAHGALARDAIAPNPASEAGSNPTSATRVAGPSRGARRDRRVQRLHHRAAPHH